MRQHWSEKRIGLLEIAAELAAIRALESETQVLAMTSDPHEAAYQRQPGGGRMTRPHLADSQCGFAARFRWSALSVW